MVLGGPYYAQNGQQMDKEGNVMATKKLRVKPGQAENQVETKLWHSLVWDGEH